MEKIEISNNRLRTYLEYELNKKHEEPIYSEELDDISQISIIGKSPTGEIECRDISDLLYFKNLTSCMIKDYLITDEHIRIINKLDKLEMLHFDNCKFEIEDEKLYVNINKLILSFCTNININLFNVENYVTYLRITSGNKINISGIGKFKQIKELYLQSINVNDLFEISKLDNLQYLNLNGSKVIKNRKYLHKLKAKVEHNENNFPI